MAGVVVVGVPGFGGWMVVTGVAKAGVLVSGADVPGVLVKGKVRGRRLGWCWKR